MKVLAEGACFAMENLFERIPLRYTNCPPIIEFAFGELHIAHGDKVPKVHFSTKCFLHLPKYICRYGYRYENGE